MPRAVCWLFQHPETKLYLMVGRRSGNGWGLPGGKVEPGESPEEALRREVREETGFVVEDARLIFQGPSAGDVTFQVDVFAARPVTQHSPLEDLPVGWLSRDEMQDSPFREFHDRLFAALEEDS